jgi:hypothetical protein
VAENSFPQTVPPTVQGVLMRKAWEFLSQQHLLEHNYHLVQALLEYDGPQIGEFKLNEEEGSYFGVAVDADDAVVRWILAAVTPTEMTAIKSGLVYLRDVFFKDNFIVVDFNLDMESVISWEVASECFSAEYLPKPRTALFPKRKAQAQPNSVKSIKLDGKLSGAHSLGFRQLSSLFFTLQYLWERIAEFEILKKGTGQIINDIKTFSSINLRAAAIGSLELMIDPTSSELFELVAARFSDVVSASNDLEILKKNLNKLGSRTKDAYSEFLGAVDVSGVELLFLNSTSPAFISPGMAKNIRKTIAQNKSQFESSFTSIGHFYMNKNKNRTHTFEFHDEQTGESFKGTVDQSVWKFATIVPSEQYRYKVKISETDVHKGGIFEAKKFRLMSAEYIKPSETQTSELDKGSRVPKIMKKTKKPKSS